MSRTHEQFREDLSDEDIERLKVLQDEYYQSLIEQDDMIKEFKESSEEELFLQILEDEREDNEKQSSPDNRTLEEKIRAMDDGGCSTGLNEN